MRTLRMLTAILLVVAVLRSTWLGGLASHGIWVDVCALATVLWALQQGPVWGSSFGFFLGLGADLDAGIWLGREALALTLIGHGVGMLSGTLVRDSWRTQSALLLIATATHQAFVLAFEVLGGQASWSDVLPRAGISIVVTASCGVVFLWLFRQLLGRPLYNDVPNDHVVRS